MSSIQSKEINILKDKIKKMLFLFFFLILGFYLDKIKIIQYNQLLNIFTSSLKFRTTQQIPVSYFLLNKNTTKMEKLCVKNLVHSMITLLVEPPLAAITISGDLRQDFMLTHSVLQHCFSSLRFADMCLCKGLFRYHCRISQICKDSSVLCIKG